MAYKLAKQIGRVPEHIVPLSESQEQRAVELHENSTVFDLHMHSVIIPDNMEDLEEWSHDKRAQEAVGFDGVKKGGLTAFIDGLGGLDHRWDYGSLVESIGFRLGTMDRNYDKVIRGIRAEDVGRAKESGKFAIFLGVENSEQLGFDVDRVDVLYGLGIRCMGLSYNVRNPVADGRTERSDGGLSDFGLEVVARMNKLGIIVDAVHSGEQTTLDAAAASTAPVIVSHTGARGVYDTKRMATDEELLAIAETGGLAGIHTGPNVLSNKSRQGVDITVDHIDYCVKLIGIDHVAAGTDNYFGDKAMNVEYELGVDKGMRSYIATHAPYMEGIESPAEWPNITRALVKRGYSDEDIQKLLGGNTMRVVESVVG